MEKTKQEPKDAEFGQEPPTDENPVRQRHNIGEPEGADDAAPEQQAP